MKHKISLFTIFLVLTSGMTASGSRPDLSAHFFQGNRAYSGGDYKKAINEYEAIIKDGFESGGLYYNLGNSYIKDGQLGRAILNYERAKTLIPRDSDLESNYAYARTLVRNYVQNSQAGPVRTMINNYMDSFSSEELAVVIFVMYLLIGGISLLGLFMRWRMSRRAGILIFLGLLMIANLIVLLMKLEDEGAAVILKSVNAKFEPMGIATIYFQLSEGEKVNVLKEQQQWLKVKRSDEKEGWIEKDALEKI